jgi:hypothetical protein
MKCTFIIPKTGKDAGKIFVEGSDPQGNCVEKVQEQLVGIGRVISTEQKDSSDDNVPLTHDVENFN